MLSTRYGAVVTALVVLTSAAWASADKKQPLPVMVLGTVDGSRLTGAVATKLVPLATSHGCTQLPMAQIETVRFDEDHQLARVSLANGDRLSGRIEAEHVELTTALGRTVVPWTKVAELSICRDKRSPEDRTYRPVPSRPIRFEVTLRDGSWIRGTPDKNTATLYCALGRMEMPWALVRKVKFHEDRETATLELHSGDALVACVDWRGFALSTGLGRVHLSTVHTREIQLSLGGIDLVAKPYDSAQGNRWFLGGLKNRKPRRIQGRFYPASEFIRAHASGRIEYSFDQPIREFSAILTMYETYCAKKGNVLFKVETDHGLVYTSPPIRGRDKRDLYLRLKPTKKLVLITDSNGSTHEDWSVWFHPEVR